MNVPTHVNDQAKAIASLRDTPLSLPSSIKARLTIPTSGADRWAIRGALSDSERGELGRTLRRIEIALTEADPKQFEPFVVGMLMAFPAVGVDARTAKMRVQMYQTALSGLPMWAIQKAAESFIRGEVERDNHVYAPSPPEMAREALAAIRPMRTFMWEISKVLAAEVEKTEEEQRIM